MEDDGVDAFVLDLRSNPGGLVQAGLDIARIWLDGPASVFHVTGRNAVAQRDINLKDGSSETDKPLVVLVNEDSASASEILAGALHDNRRAEIIGKQSSIIVVQDVMYAFAQCTGERTFGKGKIQNVFELQDGSALFVTVARYQTPDYTDIDQKGLSIIHFCHR